MWLIWNVFPGMSFTVTWYFLCTSSHLTIKCRNWFLWHDCPETFPTPVFGLEEVFALVWTKSSFSKIHSKIVILFWWFLVIICSLNGQPHAKPLASDQLSTIYYSKNPWIKQGFNPKSRRDVSPADLSSGLQNEISPPVCAIKACMWKGSNPPLDWLPCWYLIFRVIYFGQVIEYRNTNLALVPPSLYALWRHSVLFSIYLITERSQSQIKLFPKKRKRAQGGTWYSSIGSFFFFCTTQLDWLTWEVTFN